MKPFVILTAISIAAVCGSFAQENPSTILSLRKCVDEALKNNIQLKKNQLNINSADVTLMQSKAAIYPTLNGNATQGVNSGYTINPQTNQFVDQVVASNNFSINSNVTLFNWFRLMNTIRQNQYTREATKYDYKDYSNTVILNVVSAYIQVLFNKELLKSSQNQVGVSDAQMQRTSKLVKAGTLSESNFLELEAKKASDELAMINAENQLNIAKLNLIQIMNLPASDDIESYDIEVPLIVLDTNDIDDKASDIYKYAEQNQPAIKSVDLRIKSSELGIRVAVASKYPRLTLGANVSTLYSSASKKYIAGQIIDYPFSEQLTNNRSQSLSLGLSVPIFNNYTARAGVENAVINKSIAQLNQQDAKNQLRKKIEQAYLDAKSAQKKYESAQSQLYFSQESFRISEKRFNAGVGTAVDYTVASNNMVKAKSDILQAKYDLYLKTKILDFYKGNDLIY